MSPKPYTLLMLAILFGHFLSASASADVSCRMSSQFLARGEQALLEVAVTGVKPTRFPEIDPVQGVVIAPAGRGPRAVLVPGRTIEHVFEYTVSSYQVGNHTIPPVTVHTGGAAITTEPLEFSVFDTMDLQWSEASVGDTKFRYATTFKVLNQTPYIGENIPVEIKVFVPRDIFVVDWGIPDFERDGLTAWRMQPTPLRSQMNLLGIPYVSVAYPSTLAPTRTGKIMIGPAEVRLISTQVVMDDILRRVNVQTQLKVPALELNSLPLPANAPTGFDNAVGQFRLQVTTPATDVQEGDPIPLEIEVSGTGNLDTLNPPLASSSLGWKIYDASREQRADERRLSTGTITFRQFIRPLELKGEIPSFKLVFFNPKKRAYESVTSEPIPLQMTPAPTSTAPAVTGPPPAAATPIEQMTDILGLIPKAPLVQPKRPGAAGWWIHTVGATLAVILVARIFWLRHRHRLHRDPVKKARQQELRKLEHSSTNDHEFLMEAGRFIERWLGQEPSAEVRAILAERDDRCFRKDAATRTSLDPAHRRRILQTLRRAASLCLIILATAIATTQQAAAKTVAESAVDAYESARYDKAIETWLGSAPYEELSADTLYHIGNACYRAGSPGNAALYYRRALARDPDHRESRQNLRFIERKHGSLSVKRPDYQYALAKLPLGFWRNATWAGLWTCALALLAFPATRHGAGLRTIAIVGLLAGPLVSTCGALGWRYFPDDAAFAPILRQAVVIDENVTLHTEASRTSPEVITVPPGSVCEVVQNAGEWSYVSLTTDTRGWVTSPAIRMVIPASPPKAPKIRKARADDAST